MHQYVKYSLDRELGVGRLMFLKILSVTASREGMAMGVFRLDKQPIDQYMVHESDA